MDDRQFISTDTEYEREFGYVRAVRKGPIVTVSGTVAVDNDGEVVAPGNPYEQATFCLERIRESLDELGATLADVIHTRVYVTEFDYWREIGRAHAEYFGSVKSANTTVQVAGFVDEEILLEIDVQAYVDGTSGD